LRRCHLRPSLPSSSTFLCPFAPDPLRPFLAIKHSDSCPSGSSAFFRHELQLLYGQVSLIHLLGPPTILSPTTCARSVLPRHVTCGQIEPGLHPTTGACSHENSGLRLSLADSPHHAGRIEFSFLPHLGDFLRTGRSPPAALHPVSPRRSCSRLQVTLGRNIVDSSGGSCHNGGDAEADQDRSSGHCNGGVR